MHHDTSSSLTVDGQTPTVGGAGAGAPSGELTIGAGIAGADRWLNGDLAELIITRTAPTTDERQRIEGYPAHKWGLAASLPSTHPYKSRAAGGSRGEDRERSRRTRCALAMPRAGGNPPSRSRSRSLSRES